MIPVLERQRQRLSGSHWPASPAESVSFRSVRDPGSEGMVDGLERWLRGYEHLLPFKKTQAQLPVSILGCSQPPITQAPRDTACPSGFYGHHNHVHIPVYKHIHNVKKIIK